MLLYSQLQERHTFLPKAEDVLDIVYGPASQRPQTKQLVESLTQINLTGSLYLGYPILRVGDEQIATDALLTTLESGVIVFSFQHLLKKCRGVRGLKRPLLRKMIFILRYKQSSQPIRSLRLVVSLPLR